MTLLVLLYNGIDGIKYNTALFTRMTIFDTFKTKRTLNLNCEQLLIKRTGKEESMRFGNLGEDSSSSGDLMSSYSSMSPIRNQYEPLPTTSRKAKERGELEMTRNTRSHSAAMSQQNTRVVGAARRKQKTTYRQRQIADLRKIVKLQKNTKLQIPKAPFSRVVREISLEMSETVTHYTPTALEALHEATEMFLSQVFQDAYMLTLHRKCVTLSLSDMVLLRALKLNM